MTRRTNLVDGLVNVVCTTRTSRTSIAELFTTLNSHFLLHNSSTHPESKSDKAIELLPTSFAMLASTANTHFSFLPSSSFRVRAEKNLLIVARWYFSTSHSAPLRSLYPNIHHCCLLAFPPHRRFSHAAFLGCCWWGIMRRNSAWEGSGMGGKDFWRSERKFYKIKF